MRNLLERKSMVHCHINYLNNYLAEIICPFGLRIQLFPHIRNNNSDFKKKWRTILPNCSLGLMKLLLEDYKKDLDQVDGELYNLLTGTSHLQGSYSFVNKWRELNEHLEWFNREIITTKERTLRDRKVITIRESQLMDTISGLKI